MENNESNKAVMEATLAESQAAAPERSPQPTPPADQAEKDQVIDPTPAWGGGLSPMEMIGSEANDPLIRIQRIKAFGPKRGFDDGSDETGFCGTVEHDHNFEAAVRRNWGGGEYKATTTVNGKPISKVFSLEGLPSKPLNDEDRDEVFQEPPFVGGVYPREPSFRDPYHQGVVREEPRDPWARDPYAPPRRHDPYGDGGGVARAYQQGAFATHESDELSVLRSELENMKELAAETQRKLEVERVRKEAELKEAESRRQLDALQAQLASLKDAISGGGAGKSDHLEILKTQIEIDRARYEKEQAEASRRWQQELELRREKEKRENEIRREEEKRYERERVERLDREKREADARREERAAEREARRDERAREEAQNKRMFEILFANKSNPLDDLVKLKQLDGGGLEKIRELTGVMSELKELAAEQVAEPSKLDQAQQFVAGIAEAVTPVIGAAAQAWNGGKPGPAKDPQFVPAEVAEGEPAGQLPYAPESIRYEEQERPAPQPNVGEVHPAHWGQIMELAVDSYRGNSPPVTTAQHLLTCMKFSGCMQALPQLADATPAQLKIKVSMLKLSGKIANPHYQEKLGALVEILGTENGVAWVGALLAELKRLYEVVTNRLRQQQASQQAPQGAATAPVPAPRPVQAEDDEGGDGEDVDGVAPSETF